MHINTIAKLALWDEEEIKTLNPVYKSTYIPKTTPAQCITGPMEKITFLVSMEDSLYVLEQSIYGPVKSVPLPLLIINDTLSKVTGIINDSLNNPKNLQYHKVQTSENLKNIALKYNVSVDQLMEWNALRTTNIYVGQRLKLYSKESVSIVTVPKPVVPKRKYYAAKSGDTFSRIAQKNNLSIGQLQKLNPGIKINRIIIGQRLRIK
jgi:LysM repeat protein